MPEMIATRFGYSDGLLELGASNSRVVVLDADLSRSTTTEKFQKKYPDRFFQMGICEQNMMAAAAGMAVAGDIPYATDYGVFLLGRAMDQLRVSVCYTHLNVKLRRRARGRFGRRGRRDASGAGRSGVDALSSGHDRHRSGGLSRHVEGHQSGR